MCVSGTPDIDCFRTRLTDEDHQNSLMCTCGSKRQLYCGPDKEPSLATAPVRAHVCARMYLKHRCMCTRFPSTNCSPNRALTVDHPAVCAQAAEVV